MSASTPKHTKPHHVNTKFRYEITGNESSSTQEKRFNSLPVPECPHFLYKIVACDSNSSEAFGNLIGQLLRES